METKKVYSADELVPFVPIHPGEMLGDELEARGVSQRKFATLIDCSTSFLSELIKGRRSISTEMALKIEAATGIKAHVWIGLQTDYNLQVARNDSKISSMLKAIRSAAAVL